jgi:Putative Ig domain
MPPGIDVDPSTGRILGTPTTAGSYSVLITVTDSASPSVQASGSYMIDIQ